MLIRTTAAMLVMSSLGMITAPEAPGYDQLGPRLVLAAGSPPPPGSADTSSSEQKMQRRYPQPVKVGDLIGLPVLDDDDRTLGRIKSVVRSAGGKIQLIVSYGGFLGWRARLVAVPIEVVAIAGRQLAALDMTRAEFDAAPPWSDPQSQVIPTTDVILIALYRR
jgi:PRC-barrel domain